MIGGAPVQGHPKSVSPTAPTGRRTTHVMYPEAPSARLGGQRVPSARRARSPAQMSTDALTAPWPGSRVAGSLVDAARRIDPETRSRFGPIALAALLSALWLVIDPRTADFAAQAYHSNFFTQHGFALWDNHWFDGHLFPGYSLLFPPLGSVFGPRLVGVGAVLCSTFAFNALVRRQWGVRSSTAAYWFAAAAVGDLYIGRVTFALGFAFGLLAVRRPVRSRACSSASSRSWAGRSSAPAGWLCWRSRRWGWRG
jgi:hypothetical protein